MIQLNLYTGEPEVPRVKEFLEGQIDIAELAEDATTITITSDGITLRFAEPEEDNERHHIFCECEECKWYNN